MAEKRRLLLQFDSDPQPSVFDRVVAFDAGSDEVLSYGGVTLESVRDMVHGAIFTRGPKDLHRTAIFVGGSDVSLGEALLEKIQKTFLGGLRVSILLDSSGANTTAAAAVLEVHEAFPLKGKRVLVLGGTGPVGRRVALLSATLGADVRLGSRSSERAEEAAESLTSSEKYSLSTTVEGVSTQEESDLRQALEGVDVVFSCGGAGVLLLPASIRKEANDLKVAVDLNAVPPLGIEGVELVDRNTERDGLSMFGALGVGGTKMKIHRAAVAALFESNDQVLDAQSILELGQKILS